MLIEHFVLAAAQIVVMGNAAGDYSLSVPSEWQVEQAEPSSIVQGLAVLRGPADLTIRAQAAAPRSGRAVEALLKGFAQQTGCAELTQAPRISSEGGIEVAMAPSLQDDKLCLHAVVANQNSAVYLIGTSQDRNQLRTLAGALSAVIASVKTVARVTGKDGKVKLVPVFSEDGKPLLIPPKVAASQKAEGELPRYTRQAKALGLQGTVVAKICVAADGSVSSVNILRGHQALDREVQSVVKTWRYRRFEFNGRSLPFCHVANFVFELKSIRSAPLWYTEPGWWTEVPIRSR